MDRMRHFKLKQKNSNRTKKIQNPIQMSTPTTMLYQCTHEGCTKRYATTDAVKKHAKKAHPDWQLPDCRKRGEGPTFYKEVDPSTDAVQGTVVQAGAGGGESTEVSPEMALNPVLIASWTSAEVQTALFDAVVKKHVLPAELHYVHMTDDQRKKWEELFHADNVKSPFVDQTPRLVTVVLRNEHGQSEPLEVSFNLLVRLLDEKGWKGIKEEVLTNQYWIAMCIRLAKKEQLRYGMGLRKMKALASAFDYRCQPPPPPPSHEAVQAMFEEACKGSLTNLQASLSKLVRDSKK